MARTKQFDEAEVLELAVSQFWKKGYNATSMQDLVDTLGLSRSSIYDTYTDKRQLFLASLDKYAQQSSAQIISRIKKKQQFIGYP